MPHTCEDCNETFETLSRLRLHDCPDDEEATEREFRKEAEEHAAKVRKMEREENTAAKRRASEEFVDALERAQEGDEAGVHRTLGRYERHLWEEWEDYEAGNYWGLHRVFHGPAVEAVESVVRSDGWPFLLELLDAYPPEVNFDFETYPDHDRPAPTGEYEQFPHVSHVLTTVTGKQLVRTRRADDVGAIPTGALDYLLAFHRHPSSTGAWIESMSYGWAIGHPDHPVADNVQTLFVGNYEIWGSSAIEHAMHADQRAATALLEDLFDVGVVSEPDMLLNLLGRIDRGKYPDSSEHWDWETLYPEFAEGFDWDPDVRERLRSVVEDTWLPEELPEEWTFADIEF